MNELQVQNFTNELFGNVRVLESNGSLWFVGRDVATCLGYARPNDAINDHVLPEDRWGGETTPHPAPTVIDNLGRTQSPVWINESGLYSLIFSSKLPTAVEFKHWVTSQVLPTMRRIGFDRSVQMLQNEIYKLLEYNKLLYTANEHTGRLSISKVSLELDYKLLAYNVINCPYISDQVKEILLTYDIIVNNPEIDLDSAINVFKETHNI